MTYVLDTAAVVDGHDLEGRLVSASVPAAQEVATDTTEPVDGDAELGAGLALDGSAGAGL